MAIGAVYACIGLIGGAIASLPLKVYQRNGDARKAIETDLSWLLNVQPTPAMSAAVMWEYFVWSLLLHGDAFARIQRKAPLSPAIAGILPVHPFDVHVARNGDRLAYIVKDENTPQTVTLDQDDMLHIQIADAPEGCGVWGPWLRLYDAAQFSAGEDSGSRGSCDHCIRVEHGSLPYKRRKVLGLIHSRSCKRKQRNDKELAKRGDRGRIILQQQTKCPGDASTSRGLVKR
jgi:hypothetical protein